MVKWNYNALLSRSIKETNATVFKSQASIVEIYLSIILFYVKKKNAIVVLDSILTARMCVFEYKLH